MGRGGRQMRRPRAKPFRLGAMTAASAALAACGLSTANTNTLLAGPAGRPITVGISLPLFGKGGAGGVSARGEAATRGQERGAPGGDSHGGLLQRPGPR